VKVLLGFFLIAATIIRHPVRSFLAARRGIRRVHRKAKKASEAVSEHHADPQIIHPRTPKHPLRTYGFSE
jgi:hypothetical protein